MPQSFPDNRPSACPNCGALVLSAGDHFCDICGAALSREQAAVMPVAVVRRRLGGSSETVFASPPSPTTTGVSPLFADTSAKVTTPPATVSLSASKRRKHRRPLDRRPVLMSVLTLLVLLLGVGLYGLLRIESTVTAIQQVSTVPPEVSDNTWVDPTDGTPVDQVTAKVDADPARTAVASSAIADRFPTGGGGVTGRIAQAANTTGAIAAGALQAAGVTSAPGEPMTILLMGVDARPGNAIDVGVRPDSLIVLRLDPAQQSCRILSIPRDTRVALPGYGESKINHALMVGGIPYQLLVTQDYLGIDIDHYFLIDFAAFQTVVDAVGGIAVPVPQDLTKNGEVVYAKGTHDFDGAEALAFARFRSTASDGDATRVERHWAILQALASATRTASLATEVNTILPQIDEHIRTDLSVSQMLDLADSYGGSCRRIDASEIAKLDGTRVKLSDPILGHPDYFNVVSEPTRAARVAELMGEATPVVPGAGTPVASPGATPAGTPAEPPPVTATPLATATPEPTSTVTPDSAAEPKPTMTPPSPNGAF